MKKTVLTFSPGESKKLCFAKYNMLIKICILWPFNFIQNIKIFKINGLFGAILKSVHFCPERLGAPLFHVQFFAFLDVYLHAKLKVLMDSSQVNSERWEMTQHACFYSITFSPIKDGKTENATSPRSMYQLYRTSRNP